MVIDEKYIPVISAALNKIRAEFDRVSFNKCQYVVDSPFDNSGQTYENDVFSVYAYAWTESNVKPYNFAYKSLRVSWYKRSNRGLQATIDEPLTIDFIADMINDCIESLRRDFGEDVEE